ncbi:alcohol dehydrogenase catalytic domain-containing protein [Actinoplanes sp. TBRC 11911]|uniref:zinc-dependent alcohol dehydrogenase n=1 Tax=Actinoplanes sp. TBRC 11911 TaxID=2729386 RepID=UPI00145EABB4|nr:alcohol dehydrogenase catalytic domain-containing protein [Actinoplanes sp. TBRC 11911]NMO53327.1 alcohol dehydrogenase catalytic domain-containing protein [Actinoplanes sp. TBRC 11911]
MLRVIVSADGVAVRDAEVPRPGAGEVQVRTVVAGVCGSDAHALQGRHPFITLPYAPGHEVAGVVTEIGAGVTNVAVGDRVTMEPFLPCWECKQCLAGRQNVCERLGFFGCGHDQGAMAEFFTVDQRRLHGIPDQLDWTQAAFIEPLSTPVHAIRLAGGVAGKTVAILGAGTIGLLTLRAARAYGAKRVVMTARSELNRARALKFGPDAVVDANAEDAVLLEALGESADVVFDCVAEQSTMDQALALANKAGTVVVVGVPPEPVTVPLPMIQDSQLSIRGSATYLPEDFADAMRLLTDGSVVVDEMVTSLRPLAEAAGAFDDACSGAHIKVLLDLRQ